MSTGSNYIWLSRYARPCTLDDLIWPWYELILFRAFTGSVLSSADVAELVAAAASHMVTALVLLHPELALLTSFGADGFCPFQKLLIFFAWLFFHL